MRHATFLALVAGVAVLGAAIGAQQQPPQAPTVDVSNPAVFASSLPLGAAAPAFDVTNVVTNETLCYV